MARWHKSAEKVMNAVSRKINNSPELLERMTSPVKGVTRTVEGPIARTPNFVPSSSTNLMDNMISKATAPRDKIRAARAQARAGVGSKNKGSLRSATPEQIQARKEAARKSKSARETRKRVAGSQEALNGATPNNKFLGRIGASAKTLLGSGMENLRAEGNLRRAGIGAFQSSVTSAAVHGGIGYLQGDDPWEAAKTGAIRGAFAGAGYQGLKAATHANKGSIRGNLKHIGSTTKQVYQAHTPAGNATMRQNGVSNQLKRVLEANQMTQRTNSIFGFNK
ncbi:TPA: hypothetical protein QCR36_004073 [Bacillus cereus]|nr:hypothetical protein [Bacillus cereus]HDR4742539.1 hypothetical protein [Bacillus cereus]HDR4748126.1 hypothetical protein [Bacillus cereus]HDR4753600.1 hypothetical protein [Bacillus cereus]HDR4770809.1 hypothetical protein [Bacillus cereus]